MIENSRGYVKHMNLFYANEVLYPDKKYADINTKLFYLYSEIVRKKHSHLKLKSIMYLDYCKDTITKIDDYI